MGKIGVVSLYEGPDAHGFLYHMFSEPLFLGSPTVPSCSIRSMHDTRVLASHKSKDYSRTNPYNQRSSLPRTLRNAIFRQSPRPRDEEKHLSTITF